MKNCWCWTGQSEFAKSPLLTSPKFVSASFFPVTCFNFTLQAIQNEKHILDIVYISGPGIQTSSLFSKYEGY